MSYISSRLRRINHTFDSCLSCVHPNKPRLTYTILSEIETLFRKDLQVHIAYLMLMWYSLTRRSNRVSKAEKLDSEFLCMGIALGTGPGPIIRVD